MTTPRSTLLGLPLSSILALSAVGVSADEVINDDLVVRFNICTGIQCGAGESFGTDQIRLKEPNLRIHFQDTSVPGSFPTNDWRIRVNDTLSTGASYFAIDDVDAGTTPFRIEAGARDDALYVDDSGRVGIGTSMPLVEAHVRDFETPTLRLGAGRFRRLASADLGRRR